MARGGRAAMRAPMGRRWFCHLPADEGLAAEAADLPDLLFFERVIAITLKS